MSKLSPAQEKLLKIVATHKGEPVWLGRSERRTAAVLERLGLIRVTQNAYGEHHAELLSPPRSYPDTITSPGNPPTVSGTEVSIET